MKRQDVVNLLKEVAAACESFSCAQGVSVARNPETEGYLLRAKWIPQESEKQRLNIIIQKYSVEISQIDGFTVFHKPKL